MVIFNLFNSVVLARLGSHRDQIDKLIKDWSELSCYNSYEDGLRLLDCLNERKDPFLFSNEEFMYPGMISHPHIT